MTTPRTGDRGRTGSSGSRPGSTTLSRPDSAVTTLTSARGLSNSRTRIVGDRTGAVADGVVAVVKVVRTASAAAARLAARASEVVTPLGWVVAAVVPVALIAGYLLGWRELVAAAYVGVILAVVAFVYLIGRERFVVELGLRHQRVVVGEPANGVVTVRNDARGRAFSTVAEVPVGDDLVDVPVPSLPSRASYQKEFAIPTVRRGVLEVGPVRSVRADPIGMVRRELIWTGRRQLFVHPRTIAVPSTSTGLIRDLEGQPTRDLTDSDVSFHALREYMPGDERRYIHWKSTAKTGTYMVRQFEQTRRSRLLVALSLSGSDYASDDEFEMAVSAAGSLGIRAMRDAREISVVVGESTPEFAKRKVLGIRHLDSVSRARLLDDLAGIERMPSSLSVADVARVAADKVSGISVAFLVCGSTPTPADLRSASVQFAPGVDVIAVVCDPETVPGLRRVAGLSVLTIGYLDDLKLSLARAAAA